MCSERKKGDRHCMTTLTWTPEGKLKVGRQKTLKKERSDWGGRQTEAKQVAKDRMNWRRITEDGA